jgi:hypothetical protein
VALSAERLAEWMASDLSKLDLLVIQMDGLHIGKDLVLVAALGRSDCLASNRIRDQQGALPNESGSERRGLGNSRRLALSVVCV